MTADPNAVQVRESLTSFSAHPLLQRRLRLSDSTLGIKERWTDCNLKSDLSIQMNIETNRRHLKSTRTLAEANWALTASFAHLASSPKPAPPLSEIVSIRSFPASFVPPDPASASETATRAARLIQSEPTALTVVAGRIRSTALDRLLSDI